MTKIFAHRGYSSQYPENTMKAFEEAEKAKADGIEIDIQMTKDGEVVIIHDEKVDRTTNGLGYVQELSYKGLRSLNAGHRFKNIGKEAIPTLIELFDWMQDNTITCNIEMKNNKIPYKGMEEKTIELIRKYGFEKRIIFSSFNHYSLVHSYRIAPEIETAPLLSDGIYQPWIYANAIGAKGFHPNYKRINQEIIQSSIEKNIKVRAYTVNSPKAMRALINEGISAIITDEPILARELLTLP
ncbi:MULTISPECIES: glycerophosphodiester phosphodiesterase [Bacillaceae]|uniref:glycerophosphodiester phosphodiesterase n=1 Tax=Bacillaceae TaxID=186817 RepID=UPI001F24AEAE|nr:MULTISPECIES: glycerophosphodiester phosphodiesterase [Bacillaceae]MCF2649807.1 glycerophosphodiester phosphodiesterase [Niallia circulans]CAI9388915.1 Glycerophosphodiester phosphodiesterase [Bacillus sp. T2.9-1]